MSTDAIMQEQKLDTDVKVLDQLDMKPHNGFVGAMLTDLYQITMAYAYWKAGHHEDDSVFEVFFRKNPFGGEFTIFAGLEEVIRYIASFRFTKQDVQTLLERFPMWDQNFWPWLESLDTKKVRVYALEEGTVAFPREPLIRVEGPLAVCQLLETTILVLTNYSSLLTTNAARHRLAVGPNKFLLEFGLRRAQGPDGAMTASKYAFLGGFDGTSNVLAAITWGLDMKGTHAHSYVTCFTSVNDLKSRLLKTKEGKEVDFVDMCLRWQQKLHKTGTNSGELAAFVSYAQAYPHHFLALVDTYDTVESGVWNFVIVAMALIECGYQPQGIRLDSGDLAYLSKQARRIFVDVSKQYNVKLDKVNIVASNDISETVLWSLKEQGHEIDTFGVGTNLVTCRDEPALGCVYKLVEVRGQARMKISQDAAKVTIPGKKEIYRLYNNKDEPLLDLLVHVGSAPPSPQRKILCRHPFDANKRCYVTPSRVELLHQCMWDGKLTRPFPSLADIRKKVLSQLSCFREDHLRRVNPTPYKLSVTSDLYTFMHDLWLQETPIAELS